MWGWLSLLLLVYLAYGVNLIYLKISTFAFTGIVLGVLIFGAVIINFIIKAIQKKKGTHDQTSFIFPEKMAKGMDNLSQEIQYESTCISLAFLLVGSICFMIYVIFFTGMDTIMKGFIAFNAICGLVLMGSMLVTAYQQLVSLRQTVIAMNDPTQFKLNISQVNT